ncbi:MAG TPA: plastocyanin/azurin family copper-binding protein [Gemmatimonadaceae bacterium]|nr:plastocyanin/azurin family copper-binding protein [Gemmatimonadaceae bacterium]
MLRLTRATTAIALLTVAAACSRPDSATTDSPAATPGATGTTPSAAGAPDVKPTGKVIVVELITDEKGNYFKPANFEVHRGDVIRYTLTSGVHNVHFLADSNPGKKWLPPVSDFLQLPGQTYDLLVAMEPGKYYYQCDPHALLGMVGRIEVEDEDND